MKPGQALNTMRWLVRDTLYQSLSSGVFWFSLAIIVAACLFCLGARVAGADSDRIELASGLVEFSGQQGLPGAVRTVEAYLAAGVADVGGLLLALLWTAGFLPGFLEPAAASVLLAKPAPRWLLLVGKTAGVLAFVGLQAILFVGGTWIALGLRTNVWDATYLVCIPLLLFHFAVFFSFSALLAVATRSATVCVFGSVLFWLLCWGLNFGRHATHAVTEVQGLSGLLSTTTELAYWVLPKPLDFQLMLSDGLQPGEVFARLVSTANLAEAGVWHPLASAIASASAGAVLFALAAYEFVSADY
jgi:ABC-type transport system involved in multi-copper enzyme maturation permease subunit